MKPAFTGNKIILFFIMIVSSLIFSTIAQAQQVDWNTWVQQLRQEAMEQGIRPEVFDEAFAGVKYNKTVKNLDKRQPEKRLTFMQYRKTRIDPFRIKLGRSEYKKNQALLDNIGRDFGVDPCFITAFWGIETSYGRYMGTFPVIQALATLAYDSPRADYFRGELIEALHILNEGHVPLSKFKGEWAGASGHPQFMPSSWHKYAVDYDQDGHKDIWTDNADAFASIANYMHMNGWIPGQTWGLEVSLPAYFSDSYLGLKQQQRPVAEWLRLGVKPKYPQELPSDPNMMASIILPTGGPAFMVFNNFRMVMKYNNSIFYAASVGYLADQICQRGS